MCEGSQKGQESVWQLLLEVELQTEGKYIAKATPVGGAVILPLWGEKSKATVGTEPRGSRALAVETTEEEEEEEKLEEEEREEEREEMPFTTCPLHHHCTIGHKAVSRISVGFVMDTDDKQWSNTCSSPFQHSF